MSSNSLSSELTADGDGITHLNDGINTTRLTASCNSSRSNLSTDSKDISALVNQDYSNLVTQQVTLGNSNQTSSKCAKDTGNSGKSPAPSEKDKNSTVEKSIWDARSVYFLYFTLLMAVTCKTAIWSQQYCNIHRSTQISLYFPNSP